MTNVVIIIIVRIMSFGGHTMSTPKSNKYVNENMFNN